MSPIIKIPGSKSGAAKTAAPAKRTRAKATPAKPAAAKAKPKGKATPAKRTTRTTATAQSNGDGNQRIAKDGRVLRTPKDLDPRVLADFESMLGEAGERAKEAKAEHDEAIDAVHGVVVQAQEAGIPMAIIEDVTGISRQWLYKMGQFKGREPGVAPAKPAPKPRAKATATKRTAAPKQATTTAKRATKAANTTAKRSGGGPAIKLH